VPVRVGMVQHTISDDTCAVLPVSKRKWMAFASSALAASLFAAPGIANAQQSAIATNAPADTETADDVIMVTAQRRSQSVLQVPLAITAVSGDALAQKGITNSAYSWTGLAY